MVTLKIKGYGDIVIEISKEYARNTGNNFVHLASKGFYDGLTFHRVIKGFMIQGGDPNGTGIGGPGHAIRGEFAANGIVNPLRHERGAVSMARTSDPDSAGSQFFICDHDDFFLDGQYAVFGKVVKGMDVVDKIASVRKDRNDMPLTPVVIEKALVEDEEIVAPETL